MINADYANAYTEVLEILKYIPKTDYDKIPQSKIQLFQKYSNKDYVFKYTPEKSLDEQNVSKTTRTIIAILFRDYWSTVEQKETIKEQQRLNKLQSEREKNEKHNITFNFCEANQVEHLNTKTDLVKTSPIKWYQKIFIRIKNFLNK